MYFFEEYADNHRGVGTEKSFMDHIEKILSSIYLGDRFCEKIIIKDEKILFQINCISRLKEGAEEWNYYAEEDIEHGYLVFDGVIDFSSSSELPLNDEIYAIEVAEKINGIYTFAVSGCNVSDDAVSTDIELSIRAKNFYISKREEVQDDLV